MGAFLSDLTPFLGLQEKNDSGQTLAEFLADYDAYKYETPSVTTDILVFCSTKRLTKALTGLKLLMIQRGNHPGIGKWALPGGFVEMREHLADGAKRELYEETGLKDIMVEQLRTWGNYDRDPRTRIITTAFMAFIEGEPPVTGLDDAKAAAWLEVNFKKMADNCYELFLTNQEQNLKLEAVVRVTETGNGIIREQDFAVVKAKGIAFDHPCMIVDALLRLSERIERVVKANEEAEGKEDEGKCGHF